MPTSSLSLRSVVPVAWRAALSRVAPQLPWGGGVARPAVSRVRFTRRGRLVGYGVLVTVLAGVLAGLLALHSPAGVAAPEGAGGRQEVVVRPGDTLWSLAVRHEPSRDPFVAIEEIRRVNHLRGYTVHPGQTLRMP